MTQRRFLLTLASVCFSLLAVLGAWAFYDRYWRWRDDFSTVGRAYDPVTGDVFVEQAGYIWGGWFVVFGSAAIVCGRLARGSRKEAACGLGLVRPGSGRQAGAE